MSNINLYQSLEGSGQRKKMSIADSGFFWSLVLLLITSVSFGGARLVSGRLEAKNKALESEAAAMEASFGGSDLDRIVDFQVRVDEAEKSIATRIDADKLFLAIEDSIVKGVAMVSFSYDKKGNGPVSVKMEMMTSDFPMIAKQIMSFKRSDSFSGITAHSVSRGEDGISFKIDASYK